MPTVPLGGPPAGGIAVVLAAFKALTAVSESGSIGWQKYAWAFWFRHPVGGHTHSSSPLFCELITEIVSLPRFRTNSLLKSGL